MCDTDLPTDWLCHQHRLRHFSTRKFGKLGGIIKVIQQKVANNRTRCKESHWQMYTDTTIHWNGHRTNQQHWKSQHQKVSRHNATWQHRSQIHKWNRDDRTRISGMRWMRRKKKHIKCKRIQFATLFIHSENLLTMRIWINGLKKKICIKIYIIFEFNRISRRMRRPSKTNRNSSDPQFGKGFSVNI